MNSKQPKKTAKRIKLQSGPGSGHPGLLPSDKPRDSKATLQKLLSAMRPDRWSIILALVFSIGSTVFFIIGPRILGSATSLLYDGAVARAKDAHGPGIDFPAVGRILIRLLVLYGISTVLNYWQGYLMAGVSTRVSYKLRKSIAFKINRLPMRYFDNQTHGEILSRVTNDVDLVGSTLNQSLAQILSSVTTVAGILVMMLTISRLLTMAAILIIPLSLILILFVVRRSQRYFFAQQETLGHVNGHVEEMYGAHLVMKAFNGEAESIRTFSRHNDELYETAWKSQFLSGLMQPILNLVGNIGYVVVAVLGGWLAISRAIAVGDIQAFIQYVRNFLQPLSQIAGMSNILQSTLAAAERVFEFLDEEEQEPDPLQPARVDQISGAVTFNNVRFGYLPGQTVIHNFSATIKPGQKVAIVGATGVGKTTLVKLLMRLYDVDSGSILLDDIDIRSFRRADLREQFGMVLQDTWLFHGTIMENIRYGDLKATDEAVIRAAEAAYVDRFIDTLPYGYQMVLNEESSNISLGEKQLITIARAILSDPRILILDEATSSVDTRTEVLIQQAMNGLMEHKTSFIIAHRLSTIQNADLILVLEDGDIVEQGTHESLVAAGGHYADLYNSQFAVDE